MKMEKDIIKEGIKNGFLISPDIENPKDINIEEIYTKLRDYDEKPFVINKDIVNIIKQSKIKKFDINWVDFDKSKIDYEKGRERKIYNTFLDLISYDVSEEKREKIDHIVTNIKKPTRDKGIEEDNTTSSFMILNSYKGDIEKKREIQDFVKYYRNRYEFIRKILLDRIDLQNTVSINKIKSSNEKNISLIGYVAEKNYTKNGNIILNLEDNTGTIKIIATKTKKELYEKVNNVVLDDIIGINGVLSKDVIFVKNIHLPDMHCDVKMKKAENECYAVFISDVHIGIKNFLVNEFDNFIQWLSGNFGNDEQKKIASKIKYLFIVGDLVDGVGVYPGQEEELILKDIYKQYRELYYYLSKIPKYINIIMCPGNHDAVRVAEPQPAFNERIKRIFSGLENVKIVSNPSLLNIHSSKDFEGFNVLMYHGFSFPYYSENVEDIRLKGGLDRADLIMKFLLQRRHLSPTHNSNQYIPDINEDPLIIEKVPDFFVTGHIHKVSTLNYRGVTCLNCSCWLSQTKDQERRGIVPDPAKAILVNLNTRAIKIMNFMKDDV